MRQNKRKDYWIATGERRERGENKDNDFIFLISAIEIRSFFPNTRNSRGNA